MGNVRLYGSTSGYTELAPPAVAPDGVLSLPTGTGTLATAAYVDAAVAAGGKVLQVVSANFTGSVTTTSATYVTTNITAIITPSLSTSKVLIMANLPVGTDTSAEVANYTLFRGTVSGTNLMASNGFTNLYSNAGRIYALAACNFLDSPATASAQTYTIGLKRAAGTSTVSANFSTTTATIILMEVSA